jgi:hypothetical protein
MSDVYKRETYNTLTSMGYSYMLVDKAYKAAPVKTTEGVINYIYANPNLQNEVAEENSRNAAPSKPKFSHPRQPTGDGAPSQRVSKADLELKAQLLLMGYEEY